MSEAVSGNGAASVAAHQKAASVSAHHSLDPADFEAADSARNIWRVTSSADYAVLLKPEFWKAVARDLRPFDKIEVVAADGGYYAELIVTSATNSRAIVQGLIKLTLG